MRMDHKKSSGNVFPDLDLPNSEQKLLKAELTMQVQKLIRSEGSLKAKPRSFWVLPKHRCLT